MLEREFVYLACPYTHVTRSIRELRFEQVTLAAIHLMNQGHLVYSPITHCHPMQKLGELPTGWKFWKRMDEAYLRHCNTLFVLPMEGWKESTGLTAERKLAEELSIPILFLNPTTFDIEWDDSKYIRNYKRR